MPICDGIEATTKLKAQMKDGSVPEMPIICNTAYHDKSSSAEFVLFDSYIAKPINIQKLSVALTKLMRMAEEAVPQVG